MSGFELEIRLRLHAGNGYRISGWRGVCSFDGVVAPGGETIYGCEITLSGADRIEPGEEARASLRFWVPLTYAPGLAPGVRVHLLESDIEVASGVVLAVSDGGS
jgi:hypothetical protein